jgi:thiol-disulfide isomerase/thioredoxin
MNKNTFTVTLLLFFGTLLLSNCSGSKVALKGLSPELQTKLKGLQRLDMEDGSTLEIGGDIPIYDPKGKEISGGGVIEKLGTGKYLVEEYGRKGEVKALVLLRATEDDQGDIDVTEGLPPGSGSAEDIGMAPTFATKDLDGTPLSLESLKGKVVVMNFWFIRCQPCLEEMPELNRLAEKYQGQEVEFLAITHEHKTDVQAFLKKKAFDYRHIVDAKNIAEDYFISGFPTNIVVDRQGRIVYQSIGYRSQIEEALTKEIDKLLK